MKEPRLRWSAVLLTASLICPVLWPALGLAAPGEPSFGPLPEDAVKAFQAIRDDRPPPHIVRNIHYVVSNENRHYAYRDALKDPGGVYVGVGTDQNYLLAAWSHPEVLVLLDFDQVVVDLHKAYRVAFLNADTPEAFLKLWQQKKTTRLQELIDAAYPDETERAAVQRAVRIGRVSVNRRLLRVKWRYHQLHVPTFLDDQQQYSFVVDMFKNNRVFMVRGDLTADRSINDVAAAARAAHLPIRTLYLSNAERYFSYNGDFKSSMLGLPLDERTMVLRTHDFHANKYQYTAQSGANFQVWLRHPRTHSAKSMLAYRQQAHAGALAMVSLTPDKAPPPIIRTRPGDRLCCMEASAKGKKAALKKAAEEAVSTSLGGTALFF